MKSFLSLFSFLSLLLVAATIAAARKDGGEYWRAVMKDEPMPEAIKGLVGIDEKTNCHTPTSNIEIIVEEEEKKSFADDIEPIPNVSSYGNGDLKGEKSSSSFARDFEPIPLVVSSYGNGDLKGKKLSSSSSFAQDFEPVPNVSAYGNGDLIMGKKSSFAQDFEPIPNVSAYGDNDVGLKGEEKPFNREFKPEGTTEISIYHS